MPAILPSPGMITVTEVVSFSLLSNSFITTTEEIHYVTRRDSLHTGRNFHWSFIYTGGISLQFHYSLEGNFIAVSLLAGGKFHWNFITVSLLAGGNFHCSFITCWREFHCSFIIFFEPPTPVSPPPTSTPSECSAPPTSPPIDPGRPFAHGPVLFGVQIGTVGAFGH